MRNRQQWIWQHADYPLFRYDSEAIMQELWSVSKKQGELEGMIRHLSAGEQQKIFAENMVDEIIHNASIEGEILQRSSVRASIRHHFQNLAEAPDDKHTDNIASLQKDINQNHHPLTQERLHHWHHEIMIHGDHDRGQVIPGAFRDYDEMYVTSGKGVRRRIHYVALPSERIAEEMDTFLNYCNTSNDHPVIQSAIAHIWFVQIHPYGDGNGRVTRNITHHLLSRGLGLDTRYFSISHAITNDLRRYGEILEETNKLASNPNLDMTAWITWHTRTLNRAIEMSIDIIDKSIAKTKFYDTIRDIKISTKQSKAIEMLLGGREPLITNSMYRVLTGTSQVTASRQLNDLVKKGVLRRLDGYQGRSTAYVLDLK